MESCLKGGGEESILNCFPLTKKIRYAVEADLYWTSRFINHRQHGTNANDDLVRVVATHFDIEEEVGMPRTGCQSRE